MITEVLLPSLYVLIISNDASLHIGVQQSTKTEVVATVFENVKRSSTLSLIIRLLDILLLEHHCEVPPLNSKNVLLQVCIRFF